MLTENARDEGRQRVGEDLAVEEGLLDLRPARAR